MKRKPKAEGIFCIIKYRVWLCKEYKTAEYALLTMLPCRWKWNTDIITPQYANEIIDGHSMVEVLSNEHGRVWELPAVSFKSKYRGKYKYEY
jgi:hypothetical protein